ncbi:MAG: hypothetical protein Q7J47_06955 [Azoarcus sp.]|nr:hypothetical protein [Azoarcus sp.]
MMPKTIWPLLGLIILLLRFAPDASAGEPTVELPRSAQPFSVGENIVLNGLPMRMRGFRSSESVDVLVTWFTQGLGSPVVENRLGNTIVLGKAVGEYYVTVQLEPDRNGVRGLTAVSNLVAADEMRSVRNERSERLRLGLPHGSRVISDMVSEDRGKQSWHVVVENTQSEQINTGRILALMTQEGFALEHESSAVSALDGTATPALGDARTLYFKGKGKEAMATVARDEFSRTVIVINTISALSTYP